MFTNVRQSSPQPDVPIRGFRSIAVPPKLLSPDVPRIFEVMTLARSPLTARFHMMATEHTAASLVQGLRVIPRIRQEQMRSK